MRSCSGPWAGSSAVQRAIDPRGDDLPARPVTEREEEILKLVAEGDRLELTRHAIRAGPIEP